MTTNFTYKQVADLLDSHGILKYSCKNYDDLRFAGISYHSANTFPGDLFVCKSIDFNKMYLLSAIGKGAFCYLADQEFDVPLDKPDHSFPYIITSDIRKALALVSALYYDYPAKKLTMIGITGTKGKTTTTYILRSILDASLRLDKSLGECENRTSGVLSTVEVYTGEESSVAHLTTPESLELHKYLDEAVSNGLKYLTMEVTSQSYKMNRVYDVLYDVGVFLNIGEDHIGPSEHDTMDDYLECKEQILLNSETVVLNADTLHFDRLYDVAKNSQKCGKIIVFGTDNYADIWISDIEKLSGSGFSFKINSNIESIEYSRTFKTNLNGRFNLENVTAAVVAAKAVGVSDEAVDCGLGEIKVAGRMNLFEKNGIVVIVDYAHNYLSFSKLYESLVLDYPSRPIKTVYGCPGGKAYVRRRDISILTSKYANYAYLTAEDPGYETVHDICTDIAGYFDPASFPYEIVYDRTKAIEKCLTEAEKGDVILIAGKGEEEYQKIAGEFIPYESDVKVVKRILRL